MLLPVAIGTLVLATGCQGGGGGKALTKDQYLAQANRICADANERIGALPAPDIASATATPDTIAEVVQIQRAALADLRALEPPETDVPAVKEWLDHVEVALARADDARRALERDNREAVNVANAEGRDAQQEADALGRLYGATECAEELVEPTTST
jgi:hypothetical protein